MKKTTIVATLTVLGCLAAPLSVYAGGNFGSDQADPIKRRDVQADLCNRLRGDAYRKCWCASDASGSWRERMCKTYEYNPKNPVHRRREIEAMCKADQGKRWRECFKEMWRYEK
jgi:hypothetical protein